jgi:hypothetical protein
MRGWLLALTPLIAAAPAAPQGDSTVETWVGHQVLEGKRKIPLYGEQQTHTENFLIAEVQRSADRIDIRQKLCRIEVRPIKGVAATMSRETVSRLPKSHPIIDVAADGSLSAQPWSNGWGAEDVDIDGKPGATVHIDGKCAGDVYVSNRSTSTLVSGHLTDDGIASEVRVQIKQKVLGATGLCLKLVAGDSDETQTGRFAYRRVPPGTSCAALADKPWPVKAAASEAGGKPSD